MGVGSGRRRWDAPEADLGADSAGMHGALLEMGGDVEELVLTSHPRPHAPRERRIASEVQKERMWMLRRSAAGRT